MYLHNKRTVANCFQYMTCYRSVIWSKWSNCIISIGKQQAQLQYLTRWIRTATVTSFKVYLFHNDWCLICLKLFGLVWSTLIANIVIFILFKRRKPSRYCSNLGKWLCLLSWKIQCIVRKVKPVSGRSSVWANLFTLLLLYPCAEHLSCLCLHVNMNVPVVEICKHE